MTKASRPEIMKCSDCLHFRTQAHQAKSALCVSLEVSPKSEAPRCFTPDYNKVLKTTDDLRQLTSLLHGKTPQQLRILRSLIVLGRNQRMGAKYYMALGSDYIGNYVCAYLVGKTSSGSLVLCGTPPGIEGRVFLSYLLDDTALKSPKEFAAHRKKLLRLGRVTDPSLKLTKKRKMEIEDLGYEIPTIDSAPKEHKSKLKKIKGGLVDLTEMLI